ncbi:NfeD family protein [Paenibacillus marinisediminis]
MKKLNARFMRRSLAALVLLLLSMQIFTGILPQAEAESKAAQPSVVVIPIDGTVDSVMYTYLSRALEEAEALSPEMVIIELNTPGGRLDSAFDIGELISNSPLHTVMYVKGLAASAGSYLALNADEIAMSPSSAMGAAAIVDGKHELVDDPKLNATWISKMEGAASKNGRDEQIARAMVDVKSEIPLPSLNMTKKSGEVLSINTKQALKAGYAEYEAASLDDLLKQLKMDQANITTIEKQGSEKLATFLTNPIVTTILLIVGIAGIAIELIVPGFGVPGILGALSFGLYFFGAYIAGLAGIEAVVLFIIGLILLVLELFVPSFGILGILGSVGLLAGVVRAAYDTSNVLMSLGIAVVAAAAVVIVVARIFKHRGVWNKFILSDKLTTESGYVTHENETSLLGQVGIALTTLRPAGTAKFGDRRVDVVTDGTFIEQGKSVEVVQVEGVRVVVREYT